MGVVRYDDKWLHMHRSHIHDGNYARDKVVKSTEEDDTNRQPKVILPYIQGLAIGNHQKSSWEARDPCGTQTKPDTPPALAEWSNIMESLQRRIWDNLASLLHVEWRNTVTQKSCIERWHKCFGPGRTCMGAIIPNQLGRNWSTAWILTQSGTQGAWHIHKKPIPMNRERGPLRHIFCTLLTRTNQW